MVRTLLVVDDIRSNREILKNILGDEYKIVEAAHGQEAVAVMTRDYKQLSAVLLDLSMPVMDGFEVLSYMRGSETLSQLPVIVTTGQTDSASEVKALQLGANDYISKPYNSTIIKQRIKNTINLRETAATVNELQRDRLTGLFNRSAFFEKVEDMVAAQEPGYYYMSCFDVENFKIINDQYGTATGDAALKYIGVCVDRFTAQHGGIGCRIMADHFAWLVPWGSITAGEIEQLHQEMMSPPCLERPISVNIGRYQVNDLSLSASAMFDRASLAQASIKGMYGKYVAMYDESMRDQLLYEQEIITEMTGALHSGQFEAWFQPQYNHSTGALIGSEALVRWRHPTKGLLMPGNFIPVFEQNGFIYELDKFVWRDACRYLRKWTDEGRSPLPVSVNISRYDIFHTDFIDVLTGFVAEYDIPVSLLRLEITETAFASSTQEIVDIVKHLIQLGFTVEIDDFGSGYSSLNTLKEVPAQVVKLDMRFLEGDDDSGRGGNILESIVRMTKWLGMSVIAEGVETRAQADFLRSIGCSYVQGYLYARPMPAAEYEAHCQGITKEERLLSIETVENLDNNSFWDPKSVDSLIFNSYVGAACIFEYHDREIELLRANNKFTGILGDGKLSVEETLRLDWVSCLDPDSRTEVREILRRSAETGEELPGEYIFLNIPGAPPKTYLRATMRVIAKAGSRQLVYCICENITEQRQAEANMRSVANQLNAVMDSVNCGITAVTVEGEKVEYLLANDRYYEILGYTRQQYEEEINANAYTTIYPQDKRYVSGVVERVKATGKPSTMEYRALRRDGSVIWLRSSISMTRLESTDKPVQITTYTDFTAEKQSTEELLDNLPGGAALYEYDGKALTVIHLNKRYWELVDRDPQDHANISVLDAVHPEDRAVISRELTSAIRSGGDAVCDIRVLYGRSSYRVFHIVSRIVPKPDGKYAVYASYTPVSDEALSIQEMLPVALRTMMDTQTDYSFVKDKNLRYVCCSHGVYEIAGFEKEADMLGKTDYDIFEKEIADDYAAADRRVLESGEPVLDCERSLPAQDGIEHYSVTSKFPLRDTHGNIIGIYASGRDITEARAMRSQFEMLTNSIPGGIGIYTGSPDALDKIKLSFFSDGFYRLFGYTREEYEQSVEKSAFGLVFPEYMPELMRQIKSLILDNTPIDCVFRANVKGGGYKWINLKAVMGEPRGGDLTVNAVLFDVTAQQEALERLHSCGCAD